MAPQFFSFFVSVCGLPMDFFNFIFELFKDYKGFCTSDVSFFLCFGFVGLNTMLQLNICMSFFLSFVQVLFISLPCFGDFAFVNFWNKISCIDHSGILLSCQVQHYNCAIFLHQLTLNIFIYATSVDGSREGFAGSSSLMRLSVSPDVCYWSKYVEGHVIFFQL